ncbi:MAG: UbiA family prenyltransferase [Fibrella sp.]|nr:UbiA family prenyltransferase [Armatimonadota bacterium]
MTPTGAARWRVYQRERFPLVAHGPLVAAFSFSAVSFSSLLRREGEFPAWQNLAVSFITALLFFLLLRIADEFKDFEDDSRWRPYRAVPRGLVKLRELGIVAVFAGIIQVILAFVLSPGLLPYLFVVWVWLALMTKEFFVGDWLKKHPVLYMVSHMAIMPLIDLYATACDWRVAGVPAPHGLIWFLLVSFMNGIVIEVGRKLRSTESEEEGVETYTALWGTTVAPIVWIGAIVGTAVLALLAAREIRFVVPVACLLAVLVLTAVLVAVRFIRRPTKENAKLFEPISGVWTLVMYLSLGAIPRFLQ